MFPYIIIQMNSSEALKLKNLKNTYRTVLIDLIKTVKINEEIRIIRKRRERVRKEERKLNMVDKKILFYKYLNHINYAEIIYEHELLDNYNYMNFRTFNNRYYIPYGNNSQVPYFLTHVFNEICFSWKF